MVKPGGISASPVANYTSQEALAPDACPLRHPLGGGLTQSGRTRRPIPSPCTLGWNLRRVRPQRCSSYRSNTSLSLSRGRGAAWSLRISVELLAPFSWTSQRPGCDLSGETHAPAQHSKGSYLEPRLLLRSADVPLPEPRLVPSTSSASFICGSF